jgi:hypothetical protein
VDLDGFEDALMTTGNLRNANDADLAKGRAGSMDANSQQNRTAFVFPRLESPKLLFRNQHDLTFKEIGETWGFSDVGISHGMALADLDNDGDLDVVVNNMDRPAGLYRNESTAPRVAVRLRGRSPNVQAVGVKIRFSGGAAKIQTEEVMSGGRYLSGDDPMCVFAVGSERNPMTIEVIWRSGAVSTRTSSPRASASASSSPRASR